MLTIGIAISPAIKVSAGVPGGGTTDLFDINIENTGSIDKSTGQVTLTVEITCLEDIVIDGSGCQAIQISGRNFYQGFGFTDFNEEDGECSAGEVLTIPVTLFPDTGVPKKGPTSVGCDAFACTPGFGECGSEGTGANVKLK